jgi:DNA (cytosine-5)-methyltransferase 1
LREDPPDVSLHDQTGLKIAEEVAPTVDTGQPHSVAIAFQTRGSNIDIGDISGKIGSNADRASGGAPMVAFLPNASGKQTTLGATEDGSSPTLKTSTPLAIAFSCKDHGADASEVAPTLRAMEHDGSHANDGGQVAVAFTTQQEPKASQDLAFTLTSDSPTGGGQRQAVAFADVAQPVGTNHSAVRRLTPRECERLQGFPDDYTLVPYRGKPAADGPRYRSLGNSMAVPVMRWIGERIAMVESIAEGAA